LNCFNCGAELHKNDIFCINCETPVFTDDDLELMANIDIDSDSDDSFSVSSSGKLFDSLSLKEDGETEENQDSGSLPDRFVRKRYTNRSAVILIAAAVCTVIIGFAVFIWFGPSRSAPPPDTPPATLPPASNNGNNTDPDNNNGEEPPGPIYTVSEIVLFNNGRLQVEFHVSVGETIILTSGLLPEGAVSDVIWSSSDIEVIEVTQTDSTGFEARIVGVGPGVADIIVSAGGVEETFVVFVDNLSVIIQFEDALNDEDLPIWLTIMWIDEDRLGEQLVFERDKDNQLWMMESAAERRAVSPTFINENGVMTIRFSDTDSVYFLFDDGMGFYGHHGAPDNENFLWWFKTEIIEPEG